MNVSIDNQLQWRENRASQRWLPRIELSELWGHRELALFLALRDLKLRYRQTIFGVAWAILQPLSAAMIFTIVFGRLVDVPSDGIPYAVFVYAGMAAWTYFATSANDAADSLVEHRSLVANVYFPRLLAPAAVILPGLVDLAISLAILGVLMAIYGVVPGIALLSLPIWILALMGVSLALGTLLSALNVLYRDVRYALPFVLQLLLFASPVVFPSSLFEGTWAYLFAANPMVGVLDGLRWAVAGAPPPASEDLVSLATGLVLLLTGITYFQRVEREFADRI